MVLLQLSQSHLTLIEQCPRKFQYIYLDQLTTPIPPEQREHLNRGSLVHHLMQQHELQLSHPLLSDPGHHFFPPSTLIPRTIQDSQAQLYYMAEALVAAVPMMNESTVFRQSEYRLNLPWSGVLLTVIYDLLLMDVDKAHIFDWKTYLSPPNLQSLRQRLAQHWQTKLYPFVLVETSNYSPDAVELSYWFVKRTHGDQALHLDRHERVQTRQMFEPECLTFPYSDRLHQQTKQELTQVIEQVQHWINHYSVGQPLPKVDASEGLCGQCPFQTRCDRTEDPKKQDNWDGLEDIAALPEIQPFPIQIKNPGDSESSGFEN